MSRSFKDLSKEELEALREKSRAASIPRDPKDVVLTERMTARVATKSKVEAYLANVPPMWRNRAISVVEGRANRSVILKVHCAYCVGYQDVQNSVSGCRAFLCPLWDTRPYQKEEET
jgi:hypothetical protein